MVEDPVHQRMVFGTHRIAEFTAHEDVRQDLQQPPSEAMVEQIQRAEEIGRQTVPIRLDINGSKGLKSDLTAPYDTNGH